MARARYENRGVMRHVVPTGSLSPKARSQPISHGQQVRDAILVLGGIITDFVARSWCVQ